MRHAVLACILTAFTATQAQQSASFKLAEHAFNAGGHPAGGIVLSSASYRIRLDAIGDGTVGTALSSGSYRMDLGFIPAYRPAGEVKALRFASKTDLVWDPEPSIGIYNLYRNAACLQQDIVNASSSDAAIPAAGQAYLYLVTAENRLHEEGTRGYQSGGTERTGVPCP